MRFPFRKKPTPRWIDSDALNWTPEEPFAFDPGVAAAERAAPKPEPQPEPRAEPPVAKAPEEPIFFGPGFSSDEAFRAFVEPREVTPDAPPQAPLPPPPVLPSQAANTNRAPRLWLTRLGIGLAQGLSLYLLLQLRAAGVWPGSDPYLFAAIAMASIFAPLVLLEGLGEIPTPLLAMWTGIVAALLVCLGLYHHWRIQGPQQAYAGLALAVLTALMLVTAQAMLRAGVRDGKVFASYRTCFDVSWSLMARLLVWGLIAGTAWALVGSGNTLFNWARGQYPMLRLSVEPALITMPLVALVSAATFAATAGGGRVRRLSKRALLACCTVALPMLVVASAAVVLSRLHAPVSLALCLVLATLLLLSVNASYRGEAKRGTWRKASEFAGAFLIVALVLVGAFALGGRVAELGWTASRIYAAAMLAMLGLYGLSYCGAGLIGIGGGPWMQRIEPINRIMALVLIGTCLALASPLADPLKMAVDSQVARLKNGAVELAGFDFDYLRQRGVRFGQRALIDMAQNASPEMARDASVALSTHLRGDVPTPTEIGANIILHTQGARLPASLLTQDWKNAGTVPPCLTTPALSCDAWMLDLDRDGAGEILLVYGTDARWWAAVMKQQGEGWTAAASFASPACRGTLEALRSGRFTLADPLPGWRDLLVAGMRLSAQPAPTAELPCPALALR